MSPHDLVWYVDAGQLQTQRAEHVQAVFPCGQRNRFLLYSPITTILYILPDPMSPFGAARHWFKETENVCLQKTLPSLQKLYFEREIIFAEFVEILQKNCQVIVNGVGVAASQRRSVAASSSSSSSSLSSSAIPLRRKN